jgi:Replication-relaxation
MRVIDRDQAKLMCGFRSVSEVNRRLLALVRAQLLNRFFIGAGDWKKSLYALSPAGANLVQVSRRGPKWKSNAIVVSSPFLTHQLRINDLHCMLRYQPIPVEGSRFVRWESPIHPIDSQQSFIPDGYVEITCRSEQPLAAFFEVDLGHENLATWKAKVQKHLRYAIAGEFERRFHHPQFRVLVVTDSEARRQALRKTTAAVTPKIFWFTSMDSIQQYGFWSPIWFRPLGEAPISLL